MTESSTAEPREFVIKAKPATAENLKGYGWVIGPNTDAPASGTKFFEDAVALRKPTQFQSDETTILSLATIDRREFKVQWVERHSQHTQTFIPLGGKPFLAVLGRPTPDKEVPDLEDLEAFVFSGQDGFCMDIGTWHEFPFAIVDDTNVVVILREDTNQSLQAKENNEAVGPDLEKRDIAGRNNVRIKIEI